MLTDPPRWPALRPLPGLPVDGGTDEVLAIRAQLEFDVECPFAQREDVQMQ
jgi:hypothetical protein